MSLPEESGDGVVVEGVDCGTLMFTDDIAMMAGSEEEMDRMLDRVDKDSKRWKFRFNEKKSKIMVIEGGRREGKRRWWLGGKEVGETNEYRVWVDDKLI